MSKDGLWVVKDEFAMILLWNMNEWLVTYVIMDWVWAWKLYWL